MGPATTAGKYPRENNVYVCVYTYILGWHGTQMSRFGTYLGSGVTV